ncbi:helix-turn-helix transcriptional regulator [bacterium]|nr:helix-turn-helix transcriptional regulator [bacterium]
MATKKSKKKKSDTMSFLDELIGEPISLGRLLEAHRLGEEMTMAEFAKILKISASHLNDIEKGRKYLSPERAEHFAEVLGFSKQQYVRLALQDQINRANLKYTVKLEVA